MASKKQTIALEKNVLMLREEAKRLVYYYDQAIFLEKENEQIKTEIEKVNDEIATLKIDNTSLSDDVKEKTALIKGYLKEIEDLLKTHAKDLINNSKFVKQETINEQKEHFAKKLEDAAVINKENLFMQAEKFRAQIESIKLGMNHDRLKLKEQALVHKEEIKELNAKFKEELKEQSLRFKDELKEQSNKFKEELNEWNQKAEEKSLEWEEYANAYKKDANETRKELERITKASNKELREKDSFIEKELRLLAKQKAEADNNYEKLQNQSNIKLLKLEAQIAILKDKLNNK